MKSAVILGRVSTQEKGQDTCNSCGKTLLVVSAVWMYEHYCRWCAFPPVGPPVPTFVERE